MNAGGKYTNEAQQRLLCVLLMLFDDVVQGRSPGWLAQAAGATPSQITRDLDNLRTAGLAERDEATGLWRLTPRLPQQTLKVWSAIDQAERRLTEAKARFSRMPD